MKMILTLTYYTTFFFRFYPSFGIFTFSLTYIKLPQVGIRTGNVEKWKKKMEKIFPPWKNVLNIV